MNISIYTSQHYFDLKKAAVEEAFKKFGVEANVIPTTVFRPSWPAQTFGFEEMFRRAVDCSAEALKIGDAEIGIGVENTLSFVSNAHEWYYVIGVSVQTKDGRHAESFTPGISVPTWMMEQIQNDKIKMDALTQSLAGEDDPVKFFSGGTLSRKDIMVPALLLALANVKLDTRKPAGL